MSLYVSHRRQNGRRAPLAGARPAYGRGYLGAF